MTRAIISSFLLAASPAFPQPAAFQNLASTDDGYQVYFSSALVLRGSEPCSGDKIYRLVPGLELFLQRQPNPDPLPASNFYNLFLPDVSGGGEVVSVTARRDCYGGSACVGRELYQSGVVGARSGLVFSFNGQARVSRNGRYAVQFGSTSVFPQLGLLDLDTAVQTTLAQGSLPLGRQPLTSDGRVIAADAAGLILYSTLGVRRLATAAVPAPGTASLNDQGTWALYETAPAGDARDLHAVNLQTGIDTLLASGETHSYSATIANDGSLVLYVARQAVLVHPDGSGAVPLTSEPAGIREAVLSGFGNVAYAITNDNRLLKIDVLSRQASELIPSTPVISEIDGATVPGSSNLLRGAGLPTGGSVQITIGQWTAPVAAASPTEIRYQVPFEVRAGTWTLHLSPNASPLEAAPRINVYDFSPLPMQFGYELDFPPGFNPGSATSFDAVAHQDFHGFVTHEDPAAPGEIVHVYMTGLGAVTPAMPTGEPAPSNPLTVPVVPFQCQSGPPGSPPVELLFAGLAPGLVGVYQVDVRLPLSPTLYSNDPTRAYSGMLCGNGEQSASITVDMWPVSVRK